MPRSLLALGLLALIGALPSSGGFAAPPALEVGFGEADITPKVDGRAVYMAGFGNDRKATGVHDPLMARAAVLADGKSKIALVSVDLVGLFHAQVERVRRRLSGFTYVLVSSTHNHEGPDTLGLWGPSPFRSGVHRDYLTLLEGKIVEAVKAADGARRPVTARVGSVRAPELLHDGREPYILHDELTTVEFRSGDKVAGLIVNWNCHPETLDSKNTLLSADFVGPAVERLHKTHGCPVLYLTGTVGGLMTSLHVPIRSTRGEELKDGTFEKSQRYGELLAEAADRALRGAGAAELAPLEVRHRPVFLPMANKLYLLARQIGVFDREAFLWSGDSKRAEPAKDVADGKPLCVRTEVAYLRLGDLDIAAIPGEIYPELVLGKVQDPPDPGADFPNAPMEPSLYGPLRGRHRMVIGLANDEIGYIIPKRQWDEKPPFCYGRKQAQYGEINSLGPETAPLLCEAFRELLRKN
jgi:hypothetical protein